MLLLLQRHDLHRLPSGVGRPCSCPCRNIWHGIGGAHFLEHVLGLSPRPISVAWMVSHVLLSYLLRFVYVGPFLGVAQPLPLGSQAFAQFGIVHAWILLRQFLSSLLGPDHEGVHGTLDVIGRSAVGHDSHFNL